ncbi:MAG: imidazole glycerol phosphate synthase subunit HisH [Desulfovibrio sp.]|nr:imidazole glycerol phosphate synthase subunit HisH [Desulfovibrio sp.]
MLAIVDYGAGNLTSVRRALEHCGIPSVVTARPDELLTAEGVIFPGVGAAGQAMSALAAAGLEAPLREIVAAGRPFLGICLGCQILLEKSEEGDVTTLGLAPGVCRRFPPDMREEDGSPAPVPHMGWNRLEQVRPSRLLAGIDPAAEFYFVHSYYVDTEPGLEIARTRYGRDFCSVYGRDGFWAVQFHPEKSGRPGLTLLENFYRYCREAAHAVETGHRLS